MSGHIRDRVTKITDLEAEENPVDMSEVKAVETMTCLGGPSRVREARVREAMAIMKSARYQVGGETQDELTARWGCAPGTARDVIGEAWRRVQTQVLDRSGQQVYALERLRGIAEASLDEADAETSQKARNFPRKVAVSALGEILRFTSGLNAVPVEWETLSVEEKWARVDEAERKIAAVRATLPPRRVETAELEPLMLKVERDRANER